MTDGGGRRPTSECDPSQRCWVREQLNDLIFEWKPARSEDYRRDAVHYRPGVVNWDGLLFDGWWP